MSVQSSHSTLDNFSKVWTRGAKLVLNSEVVLCKSLVNRVSFCGRPLSCSYPRLYWSADQISPASDSSQLVRTLTEWVLSIQSPPSVFCLSLGKSKASVLDWVLWKPKGAAQYLDPPWNVQAYVHFNVCFICVCVCVQWTRQNVLNHVKRAYIQTIQNRKAQLWFTKAKLSTWRDSDCSTLLFSSWGTMALCFLF